jgi:hypothetical protein
MRFFEGMPRASYFFGSHEERRSVIAAFRNRFGAVFPENSKWRGVGIVGR